MRILYVSDNRCRGNYGCRATSTALSQLVEQNHEIVGVISGKYTNWSPGNLVVNKSRSARKYKRLSKSKYWKYLSQIYYMFHRFISKKNFFLGKYDFINYDLEKSIYEFKKCLIANEYLSEFNLDNYDFDAMVVNGEGSFIFATPAWRESMILMMLMYWAKKKNKKVYFLNAMLSDDPNSSHNQRAVELAHSVFAMCDVLQVREYTSLQYAKLYFKDLTFAVKPDALFTWFNLVNDGFNVENGKYFMPYGCETNEFYYKYDFTKKYILVCGSSSSLITKKHDDAVEAYTNLVMQLQKTFVNHTIFLVQPCEGDEFLKEVSKRTGALLIPMEMPIVAVAKILANASVFFTGRYHPAILASLGGTPCLFMSSNSHKTNSLQNLLQYDHISEFSCLPSDDESKQMISIAKSIIDDEKIRFKIKNRAKDLALEASTIKDLIK